MNSEKDFLKVIFQEMKPENPSDDFMNNLMARIEKEAGKQQRKKEIYSYLWMSSGIIGITGISALILFILKIKISFHLNLLSIFSGITVDPSYIVFSLLILFLLIGDTLLRKHFGFYRQE